MIVLKHGRNFELDFLSLPEGLPSSSLSPACLSMAAQIPRAPRRPPRRPVRAGPARRPSRAVLIEMLKRPKSATIAEVVAATEEW
jgi:hypothetical protein